MANKKITELDVAASLLATDLVPVVTDPAGAAATKKATIAVLAARILTALNATGGATIAGGATITGNSSVAGTLVATLFSGSGASLTNLPSAALTGALPALSGAALTALNASNLASGTVAEARLPASYTALTVTTLTSTTMQGPTPGSRATLALAGSSGHLFAISGGTSLTTGTAPAGGVNQYINVEIGGVAYRVTAVPV